MLFGPTPVEVTEVDFQKTEIPEALKTLGFKKTGKNKSSLVLRH